MTSSLHTSADNDLLTAFYNASGAVPFRLCNDYLFRALMQVDEAALKSLIQAVIRQPDGVEVASAEILNPIELGASIKEKDFILDILVRYNNNYHINIEMQVANEDDWPERSLSYLCRTFDNLNKGESYRNVKTAVQISLLDYSLFPEHPSFYSAYLMMNTATHAVYSDKFRLYVVCLNQRNLASKADKMFQLDKWAEFFRAKTWEELQMTVKDNPVMEEAASHLHKLTEEERIRYQCEARERWLLFERSKRESRKELEKELSDTIQKLDAANQQLTDSNQQLSDANQQLSDANQQLSEKDHQIEDLNAEIIRLQKELAKLQG